nr:cytochrome oxidase small assembly protein [Caenimonas sedimenti]
MADDEQRKKNVRMALVLASIVVIFFVGFIAKTWLMGR